MECVVNNEEVYLTKEELALSKPKIENSFTQQNKWLAVVPIASYFGVLSFVIGMIMAMKWFSIRNNSKMADEHFCSSFHALSKGLHSTYQAHVHCFPPKEA